MLLKNYDLKKMVPMVKTFYSEGRSVSDDITSIYNNTSNFCKWTLQCTRRDINRNCSIYTCTTRVIKKNKTKMKTFLILL